MAVHEMKQDSFFFLFGLGRRENGDCKLPKKAPERQSIGRTQGGAGFFIFFFSIQKNDEKKLVHVKLNHISCVF